MMFNLHIQLTQIISVVTYLIPYRHFQFTKFMVGLMIITHHLHINYLLTNDHQPIKEDFFFLYYSLLIYRP